MNWFSDLLWSESAAHTIFIFSIIIAAGVFLGKQKIGGISLGVTFVLFAGILMGHLGFSVNHTVVEFIRDFGLILFVFSIGLQVGPGFFASFKRGGLVLNLLAIGVVISGGLITVIIHLLSGTSMPVMVGVMSGAVTNTPGLGAAQSTISQISAGGGAEIPDIGLGYAVAYPFGVLGIILTMIFIRRLLKINLEKEMDLINNELYPSETMPVRINVNVQNPRIFNKSVSYVSKLIGHGIVISRILHNGEILSATSDTIIYENDIILIVAERGFMPEILKKTGTLSEIDLAAVTGKLISRRLLVTNREVSGKRIGALRLRTKYNVNITRVYRSGIEFIPSPQLELRMGDRLTVVGDEISIEKITEQLGNSLKRLDEPNLIPIFIGVLLGVAIGNIPIPVPGISHPLKLGIAGGPLIIAIILSKYGHKFSLVSYTTTSANLMLREIGIVLFLASVGIVSGEKFIPTLISGDGFIWMAYGSLITVVPLISVGIFARIVLKRNFFEICGLLSGSMTDPPALSFANGIAQSEAPAVTYATVYPLVMFLRIFSAQLLIMLFI